MPVACEARWDICAFQRAWGLDGFGLCAKGYWFGVQGKGLLRRFKGLSLYIELLRGFSTEVMTIEEVVLHRARAGRLITITPLSLSWCYTELGQGRAAGLGDDHRRGGRFMTLRVLGFGFRVQGVRLRV